MGRQHKQKMNRKMISMIRKTKDKRQQQTPLASRSSPNLKTWAFYKIHSKLVLDHLKLHEKSEHSLFSKAAILMPLANPLPQLKEAGFFSLEEINKTICVRVDGIVKHKRVNKEPNKVILKTSAWQIQGQRDDRYWIEIKGDLAVVLRKFVTPGVLLAICGANVCTENRNSEEPPNFQVLNIPNLSKMGPKLIMFDLNEDHITPVNEFDTPTFSMLPVVVKCISGFKSQSYIKVNPSCVIRASNQIERVHESVLPVNIAQNSTAQVPVTSALKSQQLRLPTQNHKQNSGQVPMDELESQSLASQPSQINRIMTVDVLESQLISSQNSCPISVLESQRLPSQPDDDHSQNNVQVPMDVLESQRLSSQPDDDHSQNNVQVPMDVFSQNGHSENVIEKSIYQPIGVLNSSEELLRELAGPGDLEDDKDNDFKVFLYELTSDDETEEEKGEVFHDAVGEHCTQQSDVGTSCGKDFLPRPKKLPRPHTQPMFSDIDNVLLRNPHHKPQAQTKPVLEIKSESEESKTKKVPKEFKDCYVKLSKLEFRKIFEAEQENEENA